MTGPQQDFTAKVAMVTGGASGIGAATARMLAERGAHVVIADRNIELAEATAGAIAVDGLACEAMAFDATDAASVEQTVAAIAVRLGGLDLAVNSAGMSLPGVPLGEMPLADWARIIDLNLNGLFYCLRFQIPQMLKRGGGSVVNLSSIAGVTGIAGTAAYTASKHAVIGLTRSCALDYAQQGIRVNAVAPGYVDTPLFHGRDPALLQRRIDQHPLGRMAAPAEIAEAICFLLSDRAAFITGSVQMVDGGYSVP